MGFGLSDVPRSSVRFFAPSDFEDFCNRYIFRFALTVHIWLMQWVVDGCMEGSKLERVRNDFVDLNVATYATYFDGPMGADSKLLHISRLLLNRIRGKEPPSV